ncbi:hypothetical protein X801_10524, partial [Opisthorchis viverrini]
MSNPLAQLIGRTKSADTDASADLQKLTKTLNNGVSLCDISTLMRTLGCPSFYHHKPTLNMLLYHLRIQHYMAQGQVTYPKEYSK